LEGYWTLPFFQPPLSFFLSFFLYSPVHSFL
jgi:hypothetical protein